MKCTCPNCDWSGETSELDPVGIEVFQRIEPGDTFPNGECPECESLVSIAEPLRDAAPDLLAVLCEVRDIGVLSCCCERPNGKCCGTCTATKIEAAIAKAGGAL